MRKLLVFNNVSLDGFIADVKGAMSWAHSPDPEWQAFTAENAKGESQMLFGRKRILMKPAGLPQTRLSDHPR
jgi:hypothetical protein